MINWTFKGTTEASDLGWSRIPGHWPMQLSVVTPVGTTVVLEQKDVSCRDQEIVYVTYTDGAGCEVTVFND